MHRLVLCKNFFQYSREKRFLPMFVEDQMQRGS